jgi:hypothetical protein
MGEAWATFGTFWLLVGDRDGRSEIFTLGAGGETVPVFSFEEEAHLFLVLGGLEGPWRTSEIAATDLVSALTGPSHGTQNVVLDPFPEIGFREYLGAVSLRREVFVDLITLQAGSLARPIRGLGSTLPPPPASDGSPASLREASPQDEPSER